MIQKSTLDAAFGAVSQDFLSLFKGRQWVAMKTQNITIIRIILWGPLPDWKKQKWQVTRQQPACLVVRVGHFHDKSLQGLVSFIYVTTTNSPKKNNQKSPLISWHKAYVLLSFWTKSLCFSSILSASTRISETLASICCYISTGWKLGILSGGEELWPWLMIIEEIFPLL